MNHTNLKLKARIVMRHGSQANFADILQVDEAVVSRVVRGRKRLSDEEKKRWARALRCDVNEVFND